MTRIFLVADHLPVRTSLSTLLAHEPSLLLVGEASHGPALLDQLPTTLVDVVLLEVEMPAPDGLATTQRLLAELPAVKVLALAASANERHASQLFEAGAHGYVLQNTLGEELLVAIKAVAAGRRFLCSDLGLLLLHKMLAKSAGASYAEANTPVQPALTRREMEILRLMAEGLTTGEMAEKLFTSKRTIETHRQNILEKTQTKNTAALIRMAMTQGLLD